MKRLSLDTLSAVTAERPPYDPAKVGVGVVHFGPGAFHRAHQAAYLDALALRLKLPGELRAHLEQQAASVPAAV